MQALKIVLFNWFIGLDRSLDNCILESMKYHIIYAHSQDKMASFLYKCDRDLFYTKHVERCVVDGKDPIWIMFNDDPAEAARLDAEFAPLDAAHAKTMAALNLSEPAMNAVS